MRLQECSREEEMMKVQNSQTKMREDHETELRKLEAEWRQRFEDERETRLHTECNL